MVDYEQAIRKPFTDTTKLLTGIILSIIPILNFTLVKGFAIECSGLGKARKSAKMPEWKNWWDLFVKGLLAVTIGFIYMIPAIAIFTVAAGFFFVSMFSGFTGGLSSEMMGDSQAGEVISQTIQNNWSAIFPAMLEAAPIFLAGALLALIAAYLTPMAVLNYIKKNKFSQAFALREVTHKCFNAEYFVAFLVVAVVSIMAGLVLAWIPILGIGIFNFVIGVFSFTVFGEVYRKIK